MQAARKDQLHSLFLISTGYEIIKVVKSTGCLILGACLMQARVLLLGGIVA